jgi:hypothetical protein
MADSFIMYPNPAKDHIYFSNHGRKDAVLKIYNLQGSLMRSENLFQDLIKYDIADLDNGIYLIEVQTATSIVRYKMVICK